MDIKERFQNISKNPDVSVSDFDDIYSYIVDTYSANPEKFNEYIKQLKALCLDKAIDHSKYRYRTPIQTTEKLNKSVPSEKSSFASAPVALKTSTDIGKIVSLCREESPFLSFCILRLINIDVRVPEKFHVLFSKSISEDWINKTFKPDSLQKVDNILATELDSKCSWVLLCLFHPSDPQIIPYVQKLLDKNPELLILDISDHDNGEDGASCWRKHRDTLFAGTISGKPGLLICDLLNAEQECLVKDFFGSNVNFLVYAALTSGLSGAKVILVSTKISPGDQRKHVIKIREKSRSKLKKENDNFNNFVAPYWVPEQHLTADFKESSRYHAIRYPFASKDTINISISFTWKYKESSNLEELQIIINKIFSHTLCAKWHGVIKQNELIVAEAFDGIFDVSKSNAVLDQLLSPAYSAGTTVNRDQLKKILETKIKFLECLNHGDFHSDNIQIDKSNDIFLIDFGLTGYYPAGLDYATLEASIRFKLLDYSVDPKILKGRDSDPLTKFDNLITREEKLEGEVDKAEAICSVIRERFLNDFSGKAKIPDLKVQYLFCLLALCLRQIKYGELNRRYILQILSQIIVPLYEHVITI